MGAFFKSCHRLRSPGQGAVWPRVPSCHDLPKPPGPSETCRNPHGRDLLGLHIAAASSGGLVGLVEDRAVHVVLSCRRENATPAYDSSTRAKGQCRIVTTTDCADCRATWHHVNAVPSCPMGVRSLGLGTVMLSPRLSLLPSCVHAARAGGAGRNQMEKLPSQAKTLSAFC
jgi:hypothetical protein